MLPDISGFAITSVLGFQALQGFGKHLNLAYEASSDPLTKHRLAPTFAVIRKLFVMAHFCSIFRALYIRNPTTQVSGRYSCRVSSIYEEDFKAKEMIIYCKSSSKDLYKWWKICHNKNNVEKFSTKHSA